jgi:hypothetical protein
MPCGIVPVGDVSRFPKRLIAVSNGYDEATELFGEGRVEEAIAISDRSTRSSTSPSP